MKKSIFNAVGTNLVIINALATYSRMFLCAGLSLFSSRWILASLGQTDFGLYAVVGGVMGFFGFLTGAMTGSAQRHFAYAIGQGDVESVNRWFNASFYLHIMLVCIMVLVGLPFGWFMLEHILVIPSDKLATCHKIFIWTVIALVTSVLSVPFTGMFIAKQRIFELSIFQFSQTLLIFGFAYSLNFLKTDRLLIYAGGMTLITSVLSIVQVFRCYIVFSECKFIKLRWEELVHRMRELISFAGWNLFGALGAVGSNQGLAFLMNIIGGPRLNASFGITNQISGQVSTVTQGLFNAIAPEITASEGRGNRERVISLALQASKLSMFLVCLLVIPIIFEMDTILQLWLKEVPPFTSSLCRIALLAFLIDQLTIGYMVAVTAHGHIAGYQASLGGALLLAPFMVWIFYKWGCSLVVAVGVGLLLTRSICSLGRVCWVKRLMGVPISRWFWSVAVRSMAVIVSPLVISILIHFYFEASLLRLLATVISSVLAIGISSWFLGFDKSEREFIIKVIEKSILAMRGLMYS